MMNNEEMIYSSESFPKGNMIKLIYIVFFPLYTFAAKVDIRKIEILSKVIKKNG